MRNAALCTVFLLAGCGEARSIQRPIELDLVGLSGRAETLSVLLADPKTNPPCAGIDGPGALALEGLASAQWRRTSDAPRSLSLPPVDLDEVLVVAVAQEASGTPIQVGCALFAFADLERPEKTLQLRMAP